MLNRTAYGALVALFLTNAPTYAQQAPDRALTGYTAASTAAQRRIESAVSIVPTAAQARAHSEALAREPHVAGTAAQARTRDYVTARMREWGLETEVREYRVWMPHATSVAVWRVHPSPMQLSLAEPAVPGDATSAMPQYPTVNGYSAAGDRTGELVYVNYGLIEDYAQLDSMGVSVRDRIVIARFGRSFRGIKAREAEKRGAIALILYSDPADDGFVRGDVYPEGPWRPPAGVQRGSVMNGAGDPSTPGWPSTADARRLPLDSMSVPRIPVVPIGYGNASELLRVLRGANVPQSWQGGLAFRYHAGPGPVRARVRVTLDEATAGWKTIWNTHAYIRGSELPDELVIVGAHRDAWGAGSLDNVSGTVSVLEAARAVSQLVRSGQRPRRTLVFATWDAEEWGLIGSSEYAEDDSLRLSRHAVAYLNQDGAASGPNFGAGGSPSLRSTMRDVVSRIQHPSLGVSIYETWRRRARLAADSLEPPMGDPGGGSDFAGFYNHLGIPHLDWGFGGVGGQYHSAYDGSNWMRRFGDTSYAHHAGAASVGAALLLRLANARVLPFDYVEFATTMRGYLPPLSDALRAKGWLAQLSPLASAMEDFEREARAFAGARDAFLRNETAAGARADSANAALLQVERALTRPAGLRTRPWYRNLIYASDENDAYSTIVFPSVREAIRAGDVRLTEDEIRDLAVRFRAAAAQVAKAKVALQG